MLYIVNVSGGLTSYEALRRTIEKYGKESTVALFADTKIEDEDLYRFLSDQDRIFGIEIIRLSDGRTPFQVMHDRRMITMQGTARCSIELKADVIDRYIAENFSSTEYTSVFGMEWDEENRMERLRKRLYPTPVWFPLAEKPYKTKDEITQELLSIGIPPPRLYGLGFKHNNCGGGCVKAGQAHWAHLLLTLPERYSMWEEEEGKIRDYLDKDISILRDRRNKQSKPMTLKAFRELVEKGEKFSRNDWGACGCYVQEENPPSP